MRSSFSSHNPLPMDIEAVTRELNALGCTVKGNGKGKGTSVSLTPGAKTALTKPCPLCGKAHWKKDCWLNDKGKGKG